MTPRVVPYFLPMFADTLLQWFDTHKRDLPWRGETDPYRIWVSEIILQQTRVAQGIDYYRRFLEAFPDVAALARADEAAVLKVWQGLGYYSRARNMHAAARSIMDEHGGRFPADYAGIRQLKGVGDYTAAAIGSIAFGLPHPAVDGNVLRFTARYKGLFDNIATAATRKKVTAICQEWMPADHAGTFNQAMMEMGAIQCVPINPDCPQCPFATTCYAAIHHCTDTLPVKEKTTKIKDRFFHYLIYLKDNQSIIQKRTGNDIWKGLYEFPLVETETERFDLNLFLQENDIQTNGEPQIILQKKHLLSHQRIHLSFYIIHPEKLPKLTENQQVTEAKMLPKFAVSKVTAEMVEMLGQ